MDLTTILGLVFVAAVGIAVGTDVKVKQFRAVFKSGWQAFACGLVAQFGFMPLFTLALSYMFSDTLEKNARHDLSSSVLGLTVIGCLPGSGTSNFFTYFVGGNLPLSIMMSFVSTVVSMGTMPSLLYLFYELRFADASAVKIPYLNIIAPLALTVLSVIVGMLVKEYASFDVTWWISKAASCFCLVFLFLAVLVGLMKYDYILTEGDWAFYLITLTIQPIGYLAGLTLASIMRLGYRDRMTVAFETGIQSFTTGMALAQLSFDPDKEEDVFVDVFKWSAVCSLWYAVHAAWLVLVFRKVLPGGYYRYEADYQPEHWHNYSRKRHELSDITPSATSDVIGPAESLASLQQVPPTTLPQLFRNAATTWGSRRAFAVERPVPSTDKDGKAMSLPVDSWLTWTWAEYIADVECAAAALVALGVERFGSVAVFGFNAPEWAIGGIAAIFAGAKLVGIYPTDTPETFHYKIMHSNAAVALVDEERYKKFMQKVNDMTKLKAVVVWGSSGSDALNRDAKPSAAWSNVAVHSWDTFMKLGRSSEAEKSRSEVSQRIADQNPGHCVALVYTSGTTGSPKGVMISHDNLIFACWTWAFVTRDIIPGYPGDECRSLSYLPLSHIAGFFIDIVLPAYLTGKCQATWSIFFARPNDLKDSTLGLRLQVIKPTVFLGVPRVWEKIAERLKDVGSRTTGWFCCFRKKTVAAWAKQQGLSTAKAMQYGNSGRTSIFYGLAEAMVLNPVKYALGLDEARIHVTSAAPITVETLHYFASLGITINEVFGMSESTGVGLCSVDKRNFWGSCGFATPGAQVKIINTESGGEVPPCQDLANPTEQEQGEVCFRGRHVMMGYMAGESADENHASEMLRQTRAAIDEYGWLHTGDKGCMNTRGMFRITGRFKELIIGAGGENIAPVPIENRIKELCPALSNVMMVGDQRKYNTCLITLKTKGASGESPGSNDLAGIAVGVNPDVTTVTAAMTDDTWQKYIESGIKGANADQSVCPNNAAKVQKFKILPRDFSVETGELTTTLKLRRAYAADLWKSKIEEMYGNE